jgi:hypothetical protein
MIMVAAAFRVGTPPNSSKLLLVDIWFNEAKSQRPTAVKEDEMMHQYKLLAEVLCNFISNRH